MFSPNIHTITANNWFSASQKFCSDDVRWIHLSLIERHGTSNWPLIWSHNMGTALKRSWSKLLNFTLNTESPWISNKQTSSIRASHLILRDRSFRVYCSSGFSWQASCFSGTPPPLGGRCERRASCPSELIEPTRLLHYLSELAKTISGQTQHFEFMKHDMPHWH